MIDFSKVKYRLVLTDGKNKYNITEYVEGLGWEENEKELAIRTTFSVKNDKTAKGYLSSLIQPGHVIFVYATIGGTQYEVSRGYVEKLDCKNTAGGDVLKCTCYDMLYRLQKSQDNIFYPSGTRTKTIITGILKSRGFPYVYNGPDRAHGKLVFNNDYLGDIILDVLDDARKRGSDKFIVRNDKGKITIQRRGLNSPIYVFTGQNSQSLNTTVDTSEMITRVKVLGKANDDGKRPIEAVVTGNTKYGIRQKIYTRGSDESLAAAKSSARQILNDEGKIERTISVQSVDVPTVRKGDLVYIKIGGANSFYYVKSIQHNADSQSMTMDVEYAGIKSTTSNASASGTAKIYNIGDVVSYKGGTHYVSSYSGSRGFTAKAGRAKITAKNPGSAHPYHLIHTDSSSNVYGWVDSGTFT